MTDEPNVIGGKWYIAECKPTRERTLRSSLERGGYVCYVASQRETKVYASRNRREVEKIMIPGKISQIIYMQNCLPAGRQFF